MLSKLIRLSLCTSFLFIQACSDGGSNTPPTLTISAEISVAENTTAVGTAVADDADSSDTLVLSISGGTDSALFSMDGAGVITFNTAPDFETPGDSDALNTYEMTVQVSDGTEEVTQDVVVTVTDVIENIAPTLTLDAAISVEENSTAVGTATASDSDAEDTLTFSIAGGADAAMFSIGASTGVISFNTAPDYEATGSAVGTNDYAMTVQVSDGTVQVTKDVVVTVTDIDEPPAVGNVIDGPLQHAKVFADYNGNNIHDANEPHAMTDVNGGYSLSQNLPVPANYTIIVEMTADTIDAISGESYADSPVVLKAASGSTVVTPLTTILEVAKSADPTYTAEKLATAMGLPTGVDVSSYNPFATGADQTTAHEVETVFQQVMTAQLVVAEAMKGLADVAGATDVTAKDASEAAMSAIAGMVLASVVEVNLADSTQVGELKEQAKTKAADLGITVDAAVADAMLTSASNAVVTVSAALSNLTPDTFGTSAASSVSRLKHDAAGEVKAASVAVAAADLSAPGADILAIVTAQLDTSLTLDEGAGVDAAVTANVKAVDGYLGIRNLDFELGGAGWETSYGPDTNPGNTFPTTGGNPGGYWDMDAANNETWWSVLVTAGGNPTPLEDSGLEAGKIYKVMQDSKIFSTKDGFEAKVGGMKVEFFKANADGTGFDLASDTGDMRPAVIDGGTAWATYEFEYEIPSDVTHIKFVPLWGNDNHIGVDNIVIGTDGRLPPPKIVGSDADGMIERFNNGDTKIQNTDSWNVQVGEWYGGGTAYIGFFQLPDLGQTADPFTNSELGVRLHEMGNPSWGADLSVVRVSDNTDILHETDYDLESTLIQSSFISTAVRDAIDSEEPDHNIYTSAAANVTLTAELNKAYDGGAGVGKYVVMRIAKSGDLPTSESFKIISRNAGEAKWWPTIYYNADPMPGDDTRTTLASVQADTTTGGTVSGVPVAETAAVTFQVDMSAVTTHPDGVYIAGGYFGQDGVAMSDNGSDVWSVTVDLPQNAQYLYKFRNQPSFGTWDGFEDADSIAAGGCNMGQYNDRFVDVAEADIVLPVVAYGSCSAPSTDGGDTSTPADTTAPVITLIGDATVSVEQGSTYTDAGATADTGETVTIDASAVDTSTIGSYTVTFNVSDEAMNAAEEKTRTVNVVAVPVGTVSITKVIETNCTSPFIKVVELYVGGTVDFSDPNTVSVGYMLNGAAFADRQDYFDEIRALGKVTDRYVYLVRDLAMTQADFPSTTLTEGENAVTVTASTNGDDGYQVVMNGVVVSQFGADGQDADDSIGTSADWAHNDTYFERKPGSVDDGTFNIDHWNSQPEDYLDDFGVCARSTSDPKTETLETVITLGNYTGGSTDGGTDSGSDGGAVAEVFPYRVNMDFDDVSGPSTQWVLEGDGSACSSFPTEGGNTGGYWSCNSDGDNGGASGWVLISQSPAELSTLGLSAGYIYNVTMDSKIFSTAAGQSAGVVGLKVEIYNEDVGLTYNDRLTDTGDMRVAVVGDGSAWSNYSFQYTIPASVSKDGVDRVPTHVKYVVLWNDHNHIGVDNIVIDATGTEPAVLAVPTESAAAPTADASSVLSIFSDTYTSIDGANFNPNWNQATVQSTETLADGGNVLKYESLNYQGMEFTAQDVSGYTHVHLDFWTPNATTLRFSLIESAGGEYPFELTVTNEEWVSVDIPLSHYTTGNSSLDLTDVFQFKTDADPDGGSPTVYLDNIYFHGTVSTEPTSAITVLPDVVYDAALPNRVKEGVTVKGYVDAGGLRWVRPPISGEAPGATYGTGGGSDTENIGTLSFRKMRIKLAVALPARFALDTTGQTYTHTGNWTATEDAHTYCASLNGRLATAAEVKANLVPHLAAGTWDATFGWPRHRFDHYWTGTGARAYAIELWPGWTQGSTVADAVAAGYEGFEGNKRVYAADAAQVTGGVLVEGEPSDYVRLATTNYAGATDTETVVNDLDDVFAPENWANYYPLCVAPLE